MQLHYIIIIVLFFILEVFSQTQFLPNARIEKGRMPLIMERADSLSAMRTAGFLFLRGNVKFKHDSIEFRTERARWDRNSDAVYSEGGFDFRYPQGSIKGDKGNYARKTNIAIAEGNAEARDSSGKGVFFGEKIIYNRNLEFLEIPVKPVAHYYVKEKGQLDTLKISSKTMTYNQREQLAVVADSVLITKRDVIITGDSGFFNRKENYLSIKGNPICRMSDYTVKGDSMFVELKNNEVESVLVINNAHGTQKAEQKGSSPAQHSEVFGDTLFLAVKNNKAQSLYVNINAKGLFYEVDLPDYVNKMNGDRLDISFEGGKINLAEIKGKASSLLFNINNDRKIDGKNESTGDSIIISFNANKLGKVKVKGNLASGIYYDMSKNNNVNNEGNDNIEEKENTPDE